MLELPFCECMYNYTCSASLNKQNFPLYDIVCCKSIVTRAIKTFLLSDSMLCTDGRTTVKREDEKLYIKKLRTCMNEGMCFPSGATKLFDFLYIAGEDEATDLHLISEYGITHIINCAAGYTVLSILC